jgi:hypothetical protein
LLIALTLMLLGVVSTPPVSVDRKEIMKGASTRFRVGEDVTARVAKPDLQLGALGTIVQVRGSNRYIVQFKTAVAFMWGYEIGHVADAPSPDRERTQGH